VTEYRYDERNLLVEEKYVDGAGSDRMTTTGASSY